MNDLTTIFVRVNPRMGKTRFFRAGIEFGDTWQAIQVDDATAAALSAEQMLEVSDNEHGPGADAKLKPKKEPK